MRFQAPRTLLSALACFATMLTPEATQAAGPYNLPAPTEWAAPAGAPAVPPFLSDGFNISFNATPAPAGAPVISEWNRIVKPDESFTLSGANFTTLSGSAVGADTRVLVFGHDATGGMLLEAQVWSVTDKDLTATLPASLPFGMYLVWVQNRSGTSTPVCLNRAEGKWIGPLGNKGQPGATKRVFGTSLAQGHLDGQANTNVYLKSSGGTWTRCTPTVVEPYMANFTVPGVANGTYELWVHNGHGGPFGWSGPVSFVVGSSDFTRETYQFYYPASGGDDTAAIQTRIDTLAARANGGTLVLTTSGTYRIQSNHLTIKPKVRLLGMGSGNTTLQLSTPSTAGCWLIAQAPDAALEGFTLLQTKAGAGYLNDAGSTVLRLTLRDLKFRGAGKTYQASHWAYFLGGGSMVEIDNCDFDGLFKFTPGSSDIWVHNNTVFRGNYYSDVAGGGSGGIMWNCGSNIVLEGSRFETAWPTGPGGSTNYLDYVAWDDLQWMRWCNRAVTALADHGVLKNYYIAHNTGSGVTAETNSGEMFLFHSKPTGWWGQAIATSANQRTVTVRTDGLVDGKPAGFSLDGATAGTTISNSLHYGTTDGATLAVIGGTGVGQVRTVVSHTTSSFTVDQPFRVPPANDSILALYFSYRDIVLYRNDIEAFPANYNLVNWSSSSGIQLDGNCFFNYAEHNITRGTAFARTLYGYASRNTFWNEMRDEQALRVLHGGLAMLPATSSSWNSAVGPLLLGNRFTACTIAKDGNSTLPGEAGYALGNLNTDSTDTGYTVGNVIEGVTSSGFKRGIALGANSPLFFRNNSVSVSDITAQNGIPAVPQPVWLAKGSQASLTGNTYAGGTSGTYFTEAGYPLTAKLSSYPRCLYFSGTVGAIFAAQTAYLSNVGIGPSDFTVTPDVPWLAVTKTGSSIAAERTAPSFRVNLVGGQLWEGRLFGTVTVTPHAANALAFKVGVLADIYSDNSLKGRYLMDENAWTKDSPTVMDSSNIGSGNHGTPRCSGAAISGTFTPGVEGRGGHFAAANGDHVDLGDPTDYHITGDLTVSAWVQTSSTGGNRVIVNKYDIDDSNNHHGWLLAIKDGNLELVLGNGTATPTLVRAGAADILDGTWHHVAAARSGNSMALYIDGQPLSSYLQRDAAANPSTTALPAKIGQRSDPADGGDAGNFDGRMDDVRIYNRALTTIEIAGIATADRLVAHYRLDERWWNGMANEVVDSGGRGLHGTAWSGAVTQYPGPVNRAGQFSAASNQCVNLGNRPELDLTGDMTVCVWVKTTDSHAVIANKYSYNSRQGWILGLYANELSFTYANSVTGDTGARTLQTATLLDGNWHHLAGIIKAGQPVKLYIDGVEPAYSVQQTITTRSLPTGLDARIGLRSNTSEGAQALEGGVDELRIYNRALSQAEIKAFVGDGIDTTLAGHWKFDEPYYLGHGGEVRDASASALHGTPYGITSAGGKLGRCGLFVGDRNDSVTIGKRPELDIAGDMTISAWVRTTDSYAMFANKYSYSLRQGWSLGLYSDNLSFVYANSATGDTGAWTSQTAALRDGNWHHLAGVIKEGQPVKLYIDGIEPAYSIQQPITTRSLPTTLEARIGLRSNTGEGAQAFDGSIDDLRIWTRALSPNEITAVFHDIDEGCTEPVFPPGPDSGPLATPYGDGVENLLKFAFNMNLNGPDGRVLPSGGIAGLPRITLEGGGDLRVLRYEFIRSRGCAPLVYTPWKSESLTSWLPVTSPPTVTMIDAGWERVVHEEPAPVSSSPQLFGSVGVELR